MGELGSVDESLNRAFDLAYFILGDRPASIYVAMAAMNKLKTASSSQSRRLYYTPTGRSSYPAARTKVNLSDLHLLQRLVYIESELFERLIEGQQTVLSQDDLIIRYIKHLIRTTTKHNSFYVTLGVCRLLYNYSTAETADIYNLVLQDPERIRDDYYYRSRKKYLMEGIKDRFGGLVRTQRGFRREERFQPQEDSNQYASLVKECLIRFTPWHSDCVLPREVDPRNVINQLLFDGGDPDKEHLVELNRIHTLIDPQCFEKLTAALGLESVANRLELPLFFFSNGGSRPPGDRFHPAPLTEGELDAIRRYLNRNTLATKQFSQTKVRLLIDGRERADVDLEPARSFKIDLDQGSELVELRSVGQVGAPGDDVALAVCLLKYDQSGVLPFDSAVALAGGHRLSLTIAPAMEASGNTLGATLKIDYQRNKSLATGFGFLPRVRAWLSKAAAFRELGSIRVFGPALGLVFVALCTVGVWFYLHSGRYANSSEVAQVQESHGTERPSIARPLTSPLATSSPSARNQAVRQPAATRSGSRQPPSPNTASETKESERVRGTKPGPASATLLTVRRIYVDPLGDDSFAQQLREKLILSLRASHRFEVVINRDDADAVFRGSKGLKPGSNSSILLELVNANGEVIWSLSNDGGAKLSANANDEAAAISKVLFDDIKSLERKKRL